MEKKITDIWHLLEDKGTGSRDLYMYEDPGDFETDFGEKLEDKKEIPFEEWAAKETIECLDSVMEDCNLHGSNSWPYCIGDALEEAGVEEGKQAAVMRRILEDIADKYYFCKKESASWLNTV